MSIFNAKPHPAMTCQKCGRIFEQGFTADGHTIPGHPVGHPKLCVPLPTIADRDARRRREGRRGK